MNTTVTTILLTLLLPIAQAQETAWETPDTNSKKTGFTFASMIIHPDFLSSLIDTPNTDPDENPFDNTEPLDPNLWKKEAPLVHPSRLPKCLPQNAIYHDISSLIEAQGLTIDGNQWILYQALPLIGGNVYFCLSKANADIFESITDTTGPHQPFTFHHRSLLISVPNQNLNNQPWTPERLQKTPHQIHARQGLFSRSGERVFVEFSNQSTKLDHYYEIEPIRDEMCRYADVRLKLQHSPTNTSLQTAVTARINTPLIIDLGTRGKNNRNYLLLTNTEQLPNLFPEYLKTTKGLHLDTISGIYQMPPQKTPPTKNPVTPYQTHAFNCPADFLDKLRDALYDASRAPFEDDPFAEIDETKIPNPTRVKNPPLSQHIRQTDKIFDLLPAFKHLGFQSYPNETILLNTTLSRIIAHGSPSIAARCSDQLKTLYRETPRMIHINATIALADVKGTELPQWTLEEIKKRNPVILKKFSLTGRSGERSTSGKEMNRITYTDKKTRKEITSIDYEYEIEPLISQHNLHIDTDLKINTQPLGKDLLNIKIEGTLSLPNNKPTIIELGHPNNPAQTHLLILQANIITPTNTLYHSRFQPIK